MKNPIKSRWFAGFTLTELLVSMVILTFLLLILSSATESAGRAWRDGQARTDSYHTGRSALELIGRELSSAVVDTRMQFVVGPSTTISNVVRKTSPELAEKFAKEAPIALWMAPLGEDGSLRCVGYYLHRDPEKHFYRLKRIQIAPPSDEKESPFFPKMLNLRNAKDITLRTNPTDAQWFTRSWKAQAFDDEDPENEDVVVSSAADGVIALWIRAIDVLGQPIPLLSTATNHPKSALYYNSAAYFQVATSTPFEDGTSFKYLTETKQSMKGNRLPAFVDITIVTLDGKTISRGFKIPEQINELDKNGALDLERSVADYENRLLDTGIRNARTFTTRARLINGN